MIFFELCNCFKTVYIYMYKLQPFTVISCEIRNFSSVCELLQHSAVGDKAANTDVNLRSIDKVIGVPAFNIISVMQ